MLNWKLLSHPINYIVILFMLVIAGIAGHLLLSLAGIEPANGNGSADNAAGYTPATQPL